MQEPKTNIRMNKIQGPVSARVPDVTFFIKTKASDSKATPNKAVFKSLKS